MEKEEIKKDKKPILGIIGLSTGWLVPLSGIILGIISLVKEQKPVSIGICSIIFALLAFLYWLSV